MTVTIALAALLLAADVAPEASPSARPAHDGSGAVTYVTASGRAYLDAGSQDGLLAGMEVVLRRGPGSPGRCRIEAIAPHHAVCTGARARAGDTFELSPAPEPPPPRLLPPPPAQDVLARRRAVVESAPVPLVVFQAPAQGAPLVMPRTRAVDVSVTHQSWGATPGGSSSKESIDILARGVPLSGWLFLDLDARAERWTSRQNPRFRPRDQTQIYVWQAELTAVPSDALSLSAGRVLPWGVPGATVFDGGLVSVRGRLASARAEAGLFGGTVPQPDTLRVDSQRSTGGVYWVLDRQLPGAFLRTEGRLAAVRSPELGTRGEASLTGRLFLRQLDFSAEANLGAGGSAHAPGNLDSARVDATLRPAPGLSLGGSFRYSGLEWPQTFDPAAFPGRSREADGFFAYDVVGWMRLGATGGFADDQDSGVNRKWFGPEASFPHLLGNRGTLSVGFLEERGWFGGRSAYAQLVATPWKPLWLLARIAWAHEQTQGPTTDEASVTLGARAELNRYLALRLTLSGRTGFDGGAGLGGGPQGMTAFATLQASF
jgi:hypothetical protein